MEFWICKVQVLCSEVVQLELWVEIMVRTAVGLQGLRALREAAVRPGVRFLF